MELKTEDFNKKVFDINETTKNFLGDKPVVVEFYSPHCGPCKIVKKVLEKMELERDDIDIYTVNVESERELKNTFHVVSVPMMLYLDNKGEGVTDMGAKPKTLIEKIIKEKCFHS